MKYSLVKFRVYLLGEERFAIYTDHASLRTAVKTPHLSQRMARWFSFFAEYNFVVHYKPDKTNILADALSRRPDYDPKTKSEDTDGACRLCEDVQAIAVQATTTVREEIVEGYKSDETCRDLLKYFKDPSDKALQGLPSRTRSRVHRFRVHNGLLYYAVEQGDTARVVVPNDADLRHRLLYEYHDSPSGGHLGREKTFLSLSRDYCWPHMYKWRQAKKGLTSGLSTSRIPAQDLLPSMPGNMEGVDVPLGPAVPETVELTNEYFPHLSSYEWSALERMRNIIGEAAVISLLRSASPEDQKNAAVSFMHHEIIESRKQVATPVSSFRTVPLKLDVSPYRGGENEPLSRWFVELDAAITARQLRDPMQRVLFAMSNLAGRAKSWAYGKRLSDPNCFYSYEDFKAELKAAFEPPQSEFRARAEFLKLRQGRFDLHSYAQRARFLVSSIVDEPIDVPTQVVTFMTGLNDGPIRNQLFREYPKTLDEAISRAMQEEFSIKQAKFQGFPSRPPRQANVAHDGPEPMDISYISTPGNERPRNDGKCFRWFALEQLRSRPWVRSFPTFKKRERPVGAEPPTGLEKRTVFVDTQDSGPNVHDAHAVSTRENSVSQTSSLIVLKVHVDGIATPLRALVDTGASNNFVRNEVIVRHGVFVPDANEEKTMVIRLANGSTVKMPKRVVRLAMKCEDFRGEDEFILLDLDDKFDIILGMPWLKRYQPSIDWMKMKISVDKSRDVDLCCTTTDEVVWVYTSVEEIPDDPRDIAVCDGPPCSRAVPILKKTTGGGAVRRQKKTVSFAIDPKSEAMCVEETNGKRAEEPSREKKKKTSKKSVPCAPDQGTSYGDEGSVQAQDISSEFANIAVYNEDGDVDVIRHVKIENPPSSVEDLVSLPWMSKKTLKRSLAKGEISQVCMIVDEVADDVINTAEVFDEKTRKERFDEQSWDALKTNPVYELVKEYEDIFPDKVPDELPFDRGVRHEIDILPGTKYCITRQWPLPREQVVAIDEFFAQRAKAGHVRESKSPHCSPTFCVKKATGGWRIVHAFNKLNDATIPAQTPVPRKDMILDGMVGSTVFSAIDLKDGFYQIRMREDDVPLTAVSTPSGMLWEWLVMPQGLKNAPATFNRMVTNLLRPLRGFAPSYFDDIFVHSKTTGEKSDVDVHLDHLRQVFQVMRENKLYANLKKCIFFAPEIPVLGCFVGKHGVRVDPEKVKAIDDWPVPQNVKQLRQWLGLANYLHKYTRNYAALVQPLTQLLKKDIEWEWSSDHQAAFAEVKRSLREAPVLAIANHDKPFHVVCDASDYAIGCALMQHDDEGHERVVSYQSRQLRPAERNYPVHDKELLAMKYSLVKFRVYLLGEERFAIYTDHVSLRTAVKTPHLSQRMARWFSFFAEYNFVVHYKPGKTNILADALSRRPDYDPKTKSEDTDGACRLCEDVQAIVVQATTTVREDIIEGYKSDETCQDLLKYFKDPSDKALQGLPSRTRSRVHRFRVHNGLLYYAVEDGDTARVVVPNDEGLRHRLLYEYHDSPSGGHLGREKTFLSLSRDYYWPHMYKWVRKYVRTCETCQRVKPSGSTQAPLRSLAVPSDSWKSVSMDFIFGLPRDKHGRNGILVFVDRFSKMVHLAPVSDKISAEMTAKVFVDVVFRLHGLPVEIVSDRDTRFTSKFWRALFGLLDTKLSMSTAAHPETDGQTERVNRVLEDVLRSYATSFKEWSEFLPLAEFALNNSTHVSTGHSPFYVNYGIHPRVPASIMGEVSTLSGGGTTAKGNKPQSSREEQQVDDFVVRRQAVVRFVRDAIAKAQDLQKEQADKSGRKNKQVYKINDLVLLSTANLPEHAVSNLGSSKLLPRFIGPFKVVKCNGDAYTLDIPTRMRLHPTFYVGRLKPYLPSGSADPTRSSANDQADLEASPLDCEEQTARRSGDSSRRTRVAGRRRIGPSPTPALEDENGTHHEVPQKPNLPLPQSAKGDREPTHETSRSSGVGQVRPELAGTVPRNGTPKPNTGHNLLSGHRSLTHDRRQGSRDSRSVPQVLNNAAAKPRFAHDEHSSTSRVAQSFSRSAPPRC
ncbi:Pol protein, partial [Globisporangium splendens]